jgi:two-component system chemotaxis response regulator CheB
MLPQILDQVSTVPVAQAIDGEPVRPRRIYLARPDHHMLVTRDRVRVVRGPQENGVRPAIDTLFRSAAASYGPRVIGVILSGTLSDGTLGLQAVMQQGGIAVVQDPQGAEFPEMPRNAQRNVAVDYCLPVADIPALLGRLTTEPAADEEIPMPDTRAVDVQIAEQELTSQELLACVERIGTRTTYTCPECNGTLWQVRPEDTLRFRCHVGHAYTAEAWEGAQAAHLEQALWSAVRVMEEKVAFARQMASRRTRQGLAAGAGR